METMSRPGQFDWARQGGRDMRPRPGRYARDLRWLCARHARDQLAVRAAAPTTWALRAQCMRDLGSGCAHCTPNPVLTQCTVCSHCLGNCSWTLFMNTVHRDLQKKKKKKYKIFKNFLVYDLIYVIFILKLL